MLPIVFLKEIFMMRSTVVLNARCYKKRVAMQVYFCMHFLDENSFSNLIPKVLLCCTLVKDALLTAL